jgi:hypothetical protein
MGKLNAWTVHIISLFQTRSWDGSVGITALQGGGGGLDFWRETKLFSPLHSIQTGPEVQPTSCEMDIEDKAAEA